MPESKKMLVEKAKTAIVGVDDKRCADIAKELVVNGHRVISISKNQTLASGIYAKDANLILAGTGKTIASIEGVGSLRGVHNAQNAAAAVAACRAVGLGNKEIQGGASLVSGPCAPYGAGGPLGQSAVYQ